MWARETDSKSVNHTQTTGRDAFIRLRAYTYARADSFCVASTSSAKSTTHRVGIVFRFCSVVFRGCRCCCCHCFCFIDLISSRLMGCRCIILWRDDFLCSHTLPGRMQAWCMVTHSFTVSQSRNLFYYWKSFMD